jgi:hypothetical protein
MMPGPTIGVPLRGPGAGSVHPEEVKIMRLCWREIAATVLVAVIVVAYFV